MVKIAFSTIMGKWRNPFSRMMRTSKIVCIKICIITKVELLDVSDEELQDKWKEQEYFYWVRSHYSAVTCQG